MLDEPSSTAEQPFRYVYSSAFPDLLENINATLLVSTYQAGKVIAVRAVNGRLSMLLRSFDKAMGLAINSRWMAVGSRSQIWFLQNAPDIAPQIEPPGQHDAC